MLYSLTEIIQSNHYRPPHKKQKSNLRGLVSSDFKVISYTKYGLPKLRLIVFTTPAKAFCREYFFNSYSKVWHCNECYIISKQKTAVQIVEGVNGGDDYVQHGEVDHVCKPVMYQEILFTDIAIYSPFYELFDYLRNGKPCTRLIIFTSEDRKKCFEFFKGRPSGEFRCSKCNSERKSVKVYLRSDQRGKECVFLTDTRHICQPIEFEPDKYADGGPVDSSS